MEKVTVYNSLTNKLEELKPIEEGKVSIYVCGPTVYNSPHIGNIRPVIVFDILRRLLTYIGYDVTFVSNFTDVDDKIINRSIELGVSEKELTEGIIDEYLGILDSLNVMRASNNPRVTQYMDKIIKYIAELIEKGAAYEVDGDVYFRISSITEYGELSNINIEDLIVGARIEENSKKESPLDFALWKKSDKGISWDTVWSKGRPGWHTECCVMINSIFPNHKIDIHGGGFDLKFPHHENEIAQAKAHDHNKLANIWMHNGFVNINDEKMSKSLGNVVLAKDLIAQHGAMVIRMMMLNAHYRAPLNFSDDTLASSKNELNKINMCVKQLAVKIQLEKELNILKSASIDGFIKDLCDDLNVANALSKLYQRIKDANMDLRNPNAPIENLEAELNDILTMLDVLGLRVDYPVLSSEDKEIYKQYLAFKKEKNFEESDKLRNVLIEKGIL